MEPFLKPLSAQEEKSCLDAYQRGDTKARDILVERNLRLVAHVVKKYQGLPDDLDDLISIGTIGLIKAVMTYDSKKGNRLAAYAARCIDNELLMYLRSKKKTAREISLYEPIGTDKEGNEIHLLDIVEGGGQYIEGINNLYEFDVGNTSGWMYKVNGWFPNYGCSRYQLQNGDVIEWVYTCDLGDDVGGGYATGSE